MATHSSSLSWRTPRTEEPIGLQSWGHRELDTTERLTHTSLVVWYFYTFQIDGHHKSVTICNHTKISHCYHLYSPQSMFHIHNIYFATGNLYLSVSLTYFFLLPSPTPLAILSLFSVSVSLFLLYCSFLFFIFLDSTDK